jgi:hypothetical protein
MVVALCAASNGQWTTTLRRKCGAAGCVPVRYYRAGAESGSTDQKCLIETGNRAPIGVILCG